MPSPTLSLLRGLVIADAAIFVLAILLGLFSVVMMEPASRQTSEPVEVTNGELLAVRFSYLTAAIGLPGYVAGVVGIFLRRNWGRWLYLGQVILFCGSSLATSLFDFSAAWAFPRALADIGSVLSGLIVGLTFYSPLAAEFRQNKPVQASEIADALL